MVVAPGKLLTVTRRLAARLNKSLRKPLTIESPTMIVPSLGFCSPWPFSLVSLFSVCSCWFWELALPFCPSKRLPYFGVNLSHYFPVFQVIVTLSQTKLLENHTLHSGTNLYRFYMGVTPPPRPPVLGFQPYSW